MPETTISERVRDAINNHYSLPEIRDDDDLTRCGDNVNIIHGVGDVTSTKLFEMNGELRASGCVQLTNEKPEITPADSVFQDGGVTRINHGPGTETRVYHVNAPPV